MHNMVKAFATWAIACAVVGCCKQESSEAAPESAAAASASATTAEPEPSAAPASSEAADAAVEAAAPKPTAPSPNAVNSLKSCCAALGSAGAKASMPDKTSYGSAAAVCNSLIPSVQSGRSTAASAKRTVRAQLQRVKSIPGACR